MDRLRGIIYIVEGNISFSYPGRSSKVTYLCDVEGNAISDFVKNAQNGIIPPGWHVDYKLKRAGLRNKNDNLYASQGISG